MYIDIHTDANAYKNDIFYSLHSTHTNHYLTIFSVDTRHKSISINCLLI